MFASCRALQSPGVKNNGQSHSEKASEPPALLLTVRLKDAASWRRYRRKTSSDRETLDSLQITEASHTVLYPSHHVRPLSLTLSHAHMHAHTTCLELLVHFGSAVQCGSVLRCRGGVFNPGAVLTYPIVSCHSNSIQNLSLVCPDPPNLWGGHFSPPHTHTHPEADKKNKLTDLN